VRVTQWGEYAAHFCIFLGQEHARGRDLVSASEISDALKVDLLYAQQILQRLRKGNLVKSIRGVHGGYCLANTPDQISLRDILVAAEGDTFEPMCDTKPIDKDKCSSTGACGLRGVWYELREHIDSFLSARSLSDLLRDQDQSELISISNKSELLRLNIPSFVATPD
jgi:Rrf2 family protein